MIKEYGFEITLLSVMGLIGFLAYKKLKAESTENIAYYNAFVNYVVRLAGYKSQTDIELSKHRRDIEIAKIQGEYGVKISELRAKAMEEYGKAMEEYKWAKFWEGIISGIKFILSLGLG